MDLYLDYRKALVTGGSHGIGLAIARQLYDEGCKVKTISRKEFFTVRHIEQIHLDVLNSHEVDNAIKSLDNFNVEILINNVGGGGRWGTDSIEDTKDEVWEQVYQKNAVAAMKFTRWAVGKMKKKGFGRVITIASILGKEGGGRPWFNMAKAAEISLMKCLSMDKSLVRSGITFNTVCPGPIMIEGSGFDLELKANPDKVKRQIEDETIMGRYGTAEEVASLVAYLASPLSSYINGACITVDGGVSRSF